MTKYKVHWKREYSLYYGVAALYSLVESFKEVIGKEYDVRGEGENGWFSTCSEGDALEEYQKELLRIVKEDPERLKKEIKEMKDHGEEFSSFVKGIKVSKDLSNKQLFSIYKEYDQVFIKYCNNLFKSFYLVLGAEEAFNELLNEKISPGLINDAIEFYSIPSEKAAIFKISDFFNTELDGNKRISFVKENFPWIGNGDPFEEAFTDKQIKEYVKSFKVIKHQKKEDKFNIHDPFIKIYQQLLFVKDKRDEYRREAFYYGLPFMKEIAKRLAISLRDFGFLLPSELEHDNLKEIIRKRKGGYIAELINKKLTIKAGENTLIEFLSNKEVKSVKEFKGTAGSKGIVKGKVQIIHNTSNVATFKEGNVLVAITTSQNYISAMQKAVAFVTDEGGITCHAAIVAREMKKPCIIGTKVATRVLKDGMEVEVNADTGTITILS